MEKITLPTLECTRCTWKWYPKQPRKPKRCPKCGSVYWDTVRRRHVAVPAAIQTAVQS